MESLDIVKIVRYIELIQFFASLKKTVKKGDAIGMEKIDDAIRAYDALIPDKMQHPVDKAYWGYKNGDLYSEYTKKISKRKPHPSGYINDEFNNKIKGRHRFIYECYHQKIIENGFQIDHINSVPANNSIFNLQKLTQKEHNEKTHSGKPSKGGKKQSKPIRSFKIDENGNKCDEQVYPSVASTKNIFNYTGIKRALNGKAKTCGGYIWEYVKPVNDDTVGEVWKKLSDVDPIFGTSKIKVSNFGRVIHTSGNKSYGTKHGGGYYVTNINGITYYMHKLVALAFLKKPTGNDYTTVDHIDRNTENNNVLNLRWATLEMQAANKNNGEIKISVWKDDEFIGKFESITDASKKLKIGRNFIYDCILKKRKQVINYKIEIIK